MEPRTVFVGYGEYFLYDADGNFLGAADDIGVVKFLFGTELSNDPEEKYYIRPRGRKCGFFAKTLDEALYNLRSPRQV